MAVRTYKFRLYPSKRQQQKLDAWLNLSREFYNAALQERSDAASDLVLIKGGGGALLREKIVASMTKEEIIIADEKSGRSGEI